MQGTSSFETGPGSVTEDKEALMVSPSKKTRQKPLSSPDSNKAKPSSGASFAVATAAM